MTSSSEDFQKIKEEYVKTIPEKIQSIETLIQTFEKTPSEPTLLEIRNIIHKIAGNAGSFGFDKATQLCKTWDQKLQALLKDYKSVNPSSLTAELKAFIPQLKSSFS